MEIVTKVIGVEEVVGVTGSVPGVEDDPADENFLSLNWYCLKSLGLKMKMSTTTGKRIRLMMDTLNREAAVSLLLMSSRSKQLMGEDPEVSQPM